MENNASCKMSSPVPDMQIVDEVLKEHNSASTLYHVVPIKIWEDDAIAEQHERHEMYQ
jgi:hypothetical protein